MQNHKHRIKSVIAGFIILGVCLLSLPTAAQQVGPQSRQASLSDDDFIKLNQQIKELKNPTFRAFLRTRLLSWETAESGLTRRQTAIDVATQGVTDLCEHQNEVWSPTASWLHRTFVKQIKTLQSSEDTALEICVFKTEAKNIPESDLSAAIKLLSNSETSAAGLDRAKSVILSGQVPPEAILGQLLSSGVKQSPHLTELLGAVLLMEEKQPGKLSLRWMPHFTSFFLEKSVPPEMKARYVSVVVRASRVSAEELANQVVLSQVSQLLNGIIIVAQQFAPALYPEIASRLGSLNKGNPNRTDTRLAAEERIQNASDQLEQLISEADSAPDEQLKKGFLFRAARLAKDRGQLSKAVDLAMKVESGGEVEKDNNPTWVSSFLFEIASLAVKKGSPRDATYAISKMTRPLAKAEAFRLLGEYYGANQDKVKGKEAFSQAAKQLKSVDNTNDKVKVFLSLAESLLKYEPADAYEVFRESVKAINNLPSPEKDQEKMYYVKLMPVAEALIRSFRLLATHENQTATSLATEIKLSELRVSALSGAYSGHEDTAVAKSNQE